MAVPPPPDDRLAGLAAELGWLGRRLDQLGAELLTLRAQTTPGPGGSTTAQAGGPSGPGERPGPTNPFLGPPQPGPGPFAPPPAAGPPYGPYPGAPSPPSSGPFPGVPAAAPPPGPPWSSGPYPPAPAPARRRSLRAWLATLSGARLLAWTGGAVTLLGVALLLALAASRGWFSPPVRVGAGAVLGLVLVGAGARLHRRESSRTGALALAATGIATLYLVVAAATALYGYVSTPVGLLLALVVAAGGLALADRWRALLLACGAVVGAALLAPVVTDGAVPLLVALVLVLQAAATVVALRRGWPVLVGIAAVWPVLHGTVVAGLAAPADRPATAATSLGVLLVGLGTAVGASRREPAPLPRGLLIGLLVAAPVPALTFAAAVDGWAGATVAYVAAVLLFAAAALPDRHSDGVLRVVALAAGAVAIFEATAVALDGAVETAVLLGQAAVLVAVAGVLRARRVLLVGGFFAVFGVLSALADPVPPEALTRFPSAPFVLGTTPQAGPTVAAVVVSALVLAVAVGVLVAGARVGLLTTHARAAWLWVPAGLVALYGAAGMVIALAVLVSPDRTGFVSGHALVTVSWTVVAAVLLARGVRRPALRVAGMVLVAAAVAKLILFDLVALDGLARVAAFLGAGLLLLAVGTRYARLVAEAEPAPVPEEAPRA